MEPQSVQQPSGLPSFLVPKMDCYCALIAHIGIHTVGRKYLIITKGSATMFLVVQHSLPPCLETGRALHVPLCTQTPLELPNSPEMLKEL